eukprot:Phypoly_transcript_00603.p1 GENE.Phypoly_transcript_00603~~Phypoly_transcript_00603.p1  ORF type:complete len:1348 (+),score=283.12 Phypoly_transcript_00603:279-4322(+)
MKLRIRPRKGYYVYSLVEVDVDPAEKSSVLKDKCKEKGKKGKMPELFSNNIPLDDARSIGYYEEIQEGSIIETCSNPIWVSLLYAMLGDMDSSYGKEHKNRINLLKYIGELFNSKGQEPRQPPNFSDLEEWTKSLTNSPKSETLLESLRMKQAEFEEYKMKGGDDPLGEFIKNQKATKQFEEQQAISPPKKTSPSTRALRPPKAYIPKEGSVAYALLIALHRAFCSTPSRRSLPEDELKQAAQAFTMTDIFDKGGGGFGGFEAMESTLLPKKLVVKESQRYSLTPEARPLAKACSDFYEAEKQVRAQANMIIQLPPSLHFNIALIIDSKEPMRVHIHEMLEKEHVQFHVRELHVGDFIWVAKSGNTERVLPYVIERKTYLDLRDSINDLRYTRQKKKMLECGLSNLIYLLEGGPAVLRGKVDNYDDVVEIVETAFEATLLEGFMIAQPPSLRSTVVYLMHMTYWLQKKYTREGIPTSLPEFNVWDKNYKAQTITEPKQITECLVMPAEGFVRFVLDSEFRATLNHDFAKGGLILVQGLEVYQKVRKSKLNKVFRKLVDNPATDFVETLKGEMQPAEMLTPELASYWCACIQIQGWFFKMTETPAQTNHFIEKCGLKVCTSENLCFDLNTQKPTTRKRASKKNNNTTGPNNNKDTNPTTNSSSTNNNNTINSISNNNNANSANNNNINSNNSSCSTSINTTTFTTTNNATNIPTPTTTLSPTMLQSVTLNSTTSSYSQLHTTTPSKIMAIPSATTTTTFTATTTTNPYPYTSSKCKPNMEPLLNKPTTPHPIYDLTADDDDDVVQRASSYDLGRIGVDEVDNELQRACELSRLEYEASLNNSAISETITATSTTTTATSSSSLPRMSDTPNMDDIPPTPSTPSYLLEDQPETPTDLSHIMDEEELMTKIMEHSVSGKPYIYNPTRSKPAPQPPSDSVNNTHPSSKATLSSPNTTSPSPNATSPSPNTTSPPLNTTSPPPNTTSPPLNTTPPPPKSATSPSNLAFSTMNTFLSPTATHSYPSPSNELARPRRSLTMPNSLRDYETSLNECKFCKAMYFGDSCPCPENTEFLAMQVKSENTPPQPPIHAPLPPSPHASLDADEEFARRLQAEFNSEIDPTLTTTPPVIPPINKYENSSDEDDDELLTHSYLLDSARGGEGGGGGGGSTYVVSSFKPSAQSTLKRSLSSVYSTTPPMTVRLANNKNNTAPPQSPILPNSQEDDPSTPSKKARIVRCSVCLNDGHNRSSSKCPMYNSESARIAREEKGKQKEEQKRQAEEQKRQVEEATRKKQEDLLNMQRELDAQKNRFKEHVDQMLGNIAQMTTRIEEQTNELLLQQQQTQLLQNRKRRR